jgi:hypothetical protein
MTAAAILHPAAAVTTAPSDSDCLTPLPIVRARALPEDAVAPGETFVLSGISGHLPRQPWSPAVVTAQGRRSETLAGLAVPTGQIRRGDLADTWEPPLNIRGVGSLRSVGKIDGFLVSCRRG